MNTIIKLMRVIICYMFLFFFLLKAVEYRYPLTTGMRVSPILASAQPLKSKKIIAGFTLGTGSSTNPKLESDAGVFVSLGIVSDWISTRWAYSAEGIHGELILYPLRRKNLNLAVGVGGQYFSDTLSPFYTVYCSRSLGTMTPYVGVRYVKFFCELPISNYYYYPLSAPEKRYKTFNSFSLSIGLDYTALKNTGLMFEVDIIPQVEVPIYFYVYSSKADSSYYEISTQEAKNIMGIAISGYIKF